MQTPHAQPSDVHVALLRGINVGGKNTLPMNDLAAMFAAAGCRDVVTYIQSGNVVFRAKPALVKRLASMITAEIEDLFGHRVPLVLRSARELETVVKANPFLAAGAPESALHVAFLAEQPSRTQVSNLDPKRSPPDQLAVRGRDIYLLLPNGVGRTKLTNAYLDSKLGTTSTVRNWRTVLRLLEMTGGA